MGIFTSLFSSKSNGQNIDLVNLLEIQNDEEGFQDFVFSITDKTKLKSGFWAIKCQARYKKDIVGLKVYILDNLEPGIVENDVDNSKFYNKVIILESIGSESDKLIEILSKKYQEPIKTDFSHERLFFTVFPLNKEVANLKEKEFKFKLFFDSDNEKELYSEIYLNTDFPNNRIELKEKDEEYRENIIKALSKK